MKIHEYQGKEILRQFGVPVPREPFSFGGWKDSIVGGGDITGRSAVRFWTKIKKISCKWNPDKPLLWLA